MTITINDKDKEKMNIKIKTKAGTVIAKLNDSETAKKIFEALPLKAKAQTWGQEIYFEIPVKLKAENPKTIVEKFDLGYWLQGSCFCIFFGPTPISQGNEIKPASAVNVFGKVIRGAENLFKVRDGEEIILEAE